jgi:hypothetical protein
VGGRGSRTNNEQPIAMDIQNLHTPEASKPLLALLERYAYFRTESIGRLVLDELNKGNAELYVMVHKDNGRPALMIGADGPLTMWFATTSVEPDQSDATDDDEDVILRSHRASDLMRMMEKEKKLPFIVLRLNGYLDTEAWVIRDKRGTRISEPLISADAQPQAEN